jgi:hypothetical protein
MAHINFSTEEAATGWKTQARETLTYWVPEVDIKGTLPKDLVGTFFRNGTILTPISFAPKHIDLAATILIYTPIIRSFLTLVSQQTKSKQSFDRFVSSFRVYHLLFFSR